MFCQELQRQSEKLLEHLDFFKQPIPTLNLNGKVRTSTLIGSFISLSMLLVLAVYADYKLAILISRKNPIVSFFVEEQALTSEQKLNLRDAGLRFAWTIEGYIDKKKKVDPRYVKYLVRTYGAKDGKTYEKIFDYHECTEEELKQFAPPTRDAEFLLKELQENQDRALFCIDWDKIGDEMVIYGEEHYIDYQIIDIVLVPCHYIHNVLGWTGDRETPECLADREKAEDYLRNLRVLVYMSE